MEETVALLAVECLNCGCRRAIFGSTLHALGGGACPRCDYVGWAASDALSEDERRALREFPLELRRRLRLHLARVGRG
jgi:hypothetical protein